uniref:Uncharacterized protein n=1 Tax=Virgibacillus oceani TaxID=1479511 RepID=A0A917HGY6_9BACI|nr:hypothetical protein GCM10011398_24330 [Virgibacillus oceani]
MSGTWGLTPRPAQFTDPSSRINMYSFQINAYAKWDNERDTGTDPSSRDRGTDPMSR